MAEASAAARYHDYPVDSFQDLPSLDSALQRGMAKEWNTGTLLAAYHRAVKLGMRPGERARPADPGRTVLLQRVLGCLAPELLPRAPSLREPKHCALLLWAGARAGCWDRRLAAALLARLREGGWELLRRASGEDHGMLWWALSEAPPAVRTALPVAQVLQASESALLRLPPADLYPHDCANVLQAASRLRMGSAALLARVTGRLAEDAAQADSRDLANALTALGRLADAGRYQPSPADLQLLAAEVRARLDAQPGGDTAEGGDARGGQDEGEHSGDAAAPAGAAPPGGSDGFSPQAQVHMLWACAKLRLDDAGLLAPLTAAVGRAAADLEPRHLAAALYSLALLGCLGAEHAPLRGALAATAAQRLRSQPAAFKPQELSNVMWAVGHLRLHNGERAAADESQGRLLEALRAAAREAQRRGFRDFTPQNLSNAAWAVAKASQGPQGWEPDGWQQAWLEAAVQAALRPGYLQVARPQELSNLLYAAARLLSRPPPALLEGMAESEALRVAARAQECANSLWALATLFGGLEGLHEGSRAAVVALVGVLAGRLGRLLGSQRPEQRPETQHLVSSLWALAVMGPGVLSRHSGLVEGLLREAVRRWQEEGARTFTHVQLAQLWHVQLELEQLGAEAGGGGGGLGGILAAARWRSGKTLLGCMQATAEEPAGRDDRDETQLAEAVVAALKRLAAEVNRRQPSKGTAAYVPILSVRAGVWLPKLCRSVHAVVWQQGGRRVAVCAAGPSAFLANHTLPRVKAGAAQLRERQLERAFGAGNVVCVPHWEWEALRSEEERAEYLRRVLRLGYGGERVHAPC